MQKRTKSLLEELETIGTKDIDLIIENRANNIITGAINLLELINKHFDEGKAELLEKKLLSSIRGRDQNRFIRTIRRKPE